MRKLLSLFRPRALLLLLAATGLGWVVSASLGAPPQLVTLFALPFCLTLVFSCNFAAVWVCKKMVVACWRHFAPPATPPATDTKATGG